jgi:hypothetical protein
MEVAMTKKEKKDVTEKEDAQEARKTPAEKERELDDALEQSFPASDPPSQTDPTKKAGGTASGGDKRK